MKQKLIAKKSFKLDDENRYLKVGEEFETTSRWAAMYLAAGFATHPGEKIKTKRRYRRRDMVAEG